jgi:hypothetical protein
MTPPPALTPAEAQRLEECEGVIQAGRQTFIDVGIALATIREERLYRTGYSTFEQYCRDRWEFGARQAYRLCAAAEAIGGWRNATPGSQTVPILPDSEKQVRALLRLPAPERLPVWRQAVERSQNGRPSSRVVEELVNAILGKAKGERLNAKGETPTSAFSLQPSAFRPFRVAFERPGDLRWVVEEAIRRVRELVELLGTPDSAVQADAQTALELLERLPKHLAAVQSRVREHEARR